MKNSKELDEGFSSKEQQDFPLIINACVLRGSCPCECVHCPVGITLKEKRGAFFGVEEMRLETFKKIISQASKNKQSVVRIHAVGEPLLWKHIIPALDFLKEKGVKSWIFTCAVTKNPKILEKLAECCSIIEVSVNSFDKKNYKETKGIDEFALVKKNIMLLKEIKENKGFTARVLTTRVESSDKEYDQKFSEFWKNSGLVDDSFVRSYHNYNNAIKSIDGIQPDKEIFQCLVHWSRFNIDCNGDAVVCFNELFKGTRVNEELVLGNVNELPISEIWQSEKLRKIRAAQSKKDYSIVDFTKKLPCKECSFCQPLSTLRQTSEHQVKAITGVDC